MYGINILLIEDDDRIREIVKKYLEHQQYMVFEAVSGDSAFQQIEEREYHIIILDVMLPDMDGWTILRKIRETKDTPVIMLTARSEEDDKLFGFELGADDYVTKPFSNKLLLARIKAILKRNRIASIGNEIKINNIRVNKEKREVYVREEKVKVTPIEYSLLLYFIDNVNIALSRGQILNSVWGYDYFGEERTVDTHVKRLRKKLGEESKSIKTEIGYGYKMINKEENR